MLKLEFGVHWGGLDMSGAKKQDSLKAPAGPIFTLFLDGDENIRYMRKLEFGVHQSGLDMFGDKKKTHFGAQSILLHQRARFCAIFCGGHNKRPMRELQFGVHRGGLDMFGSKKIRRTFGAQTSAFNAPTGPFSCRFLR